MDRNDLGSWNQENDLPFRIQALYDLGYTLFFASNFWKKLQAVFGEFCISILEKVADAP